MSIEVRLIGNEGFRVAGPGATVYIDAFFEGFFPLAKGRAAVPDGPADLILVTHAHWDHFDRAAVARAAEASGAVVAGPAPVVRALRRRLPEDRLMELEPHEARGGRPFASTGGELPNVRVTAWRTSHGRAHNSYLVEMDGFRFFHDGDNEETRRLDAARLRPLDALRRCPWQGSGWADFVESADPKRWFLMHLSDDELAQHRRGEFLPDLCSRVPLPDRIVALAPGEAYRFD